MARILLSAIVTEIRGKIGGTVFQAGQGGFQAKRLTIPRDPRIDIQITRRIDFTSVAQSWQSISGSDRTTWGANADPGLTGYSTFMRRNANMRFFQQSAFTTFPGSSTAATVDLRDTFIRPSTFLVTGRSPFENVPSGQVVAIMVTKCNSQGKQAYSPSEYKLMDYITGPFDTLSNPIEEISNYTSLFGVPVAGRAISIRAVCIDTATGNTQITAAGTIVVIP